MAGIAPGSVLGSSVLGKRGIFLNREKGFDVVGIEIGAGGFVDKAAAVDDEGAVGDIDHETDDLLGDKDGQGVDFLDFAEGLCNILDDRWLNTLGGFVEKQGLGFGEEGSSDGELLLLSAGEVAGLALAHIKENGKECVNFVQIRIGRRRGGAGKEVFENGHVRKNHSALWNEGEAMADALVDREGVDGFAVEGDRAGGGSGKAHEGFEEGGFPHAVAAHDGEDFPFGYGEIDTVYDFALAVTAMELVDGDHGVSGRGRHVEHRGFFGCFP